MLLERGDTVLRFMQRHVLDKHGLGQQIDSIRLLRRRLANERFRFGILGLAALLLQAGEKRGDKIAFLGRHDGLAGDEVVA